MSAINQKYLDFAIQVARHAGDAILMKHYGKQQFQTWKARTDFKTMVDDESDRYIREEIRKSFPDHSVISEELEDYETGSEYKWVVDPLDGTLPYTFGTTDHFSVCIGLCQNGIPILGVIYAPKRGEFYTAVVGEAHCNGIPIEVSSETEINHILMGVDPGATNRKSHLPYLERLMEKDGCICTVQSACASVPLCLVAKGNLHAYLATSLLPWDMAAAVCIIREAGGRVTHLDGSDWKLGGRSILACNPELHGKLLEFFKSKYQE